ncbi:hypothetical protein RHGRI_008735 [Rhododendron griersonianum]|uniref:3'-5' exonuclease domain-containing protein n=1 Tax=Rhododendron griersonianum TaxID=479676 RepID=A0AAV6L3N2_9ERIC|nr:hypothetical protein RHGRI_008735 [Rhododendron griersonianum]
MEAENHNPPTIYSVSSVDSPEFTHFTRALTRSSVIGLDAEWKPLRVHQPTFPTVSLVQIACRSGGDESSVFLLDLFAIPLPSIYGLLKDVFVSPDVLKLGFRFKQDLVYLSSTFCSQGCDPGFDRVEPFLDITSIYNYLQHKQLGRKIPKQIKSLATICEEVLGISLSKVCSRKIAFCSLGGFKPENFNVVIGHVVPLQQSKKHMQLKMHIVCLKSLRSSRSRLAKKV